MVNCENYKIKYNQLLKRFYNGCKYLETNPNEWDNYINLLLDIVNQIEKTLNIIENSDENVTKDDILNGFSV